MHDTIARHLRGLSAESSLSLARGDLHELAGVELKLSRHGINPVLLAHGLTRNGVDLRWGRLEAWSSTIGLVMPRGLAAR
jgi:hypothetical protein